MTERQMLRENPCESYFVTGMMMATGGFLEVYTYLLKGGVFANAQTGNVALLGLALARGDWMRVLFCIVPIVSYIIGIWLTLHMPERLQRGLRWETMFVLMEILVLLGIGFLPADAPFELSTVAVSFVCAMQYNTFKQAHGIPMATTFCTNNLRQMVISWYNAVHRTDKDARRKAWFFFRHLLCFAGGAMAAGFLCSVLGERAVWVNAAALIPAAAVMIYADVRKNSRIQRKNNQKGVSTKNGFKRR